MLSSVFTSLPLQKTKFFHRHENSSPNIPKTILPARKLKYSESVLPVLSSLRKICQNTGFPWPLFYRVSVATISPDKYRILDSIFFAGKYGAGKTCLQAYFTQCICCMQIDGYSVWICGNSPSTHSYQYLVDVQLALIYELH